MGGRSDLGFVTDAFERTTVLLVHGELIARSCTFPRFQGACDGRVHQATGPRSDGKPLSQTLARRPHNKAAIRGPRGSKRSAPRIGGRHDQD